MAGTEDIAVIGAVICQELGMEIDELEMDTDLRTSGLNSLSALMITLKLQEEHRIQLGPGTLKENYTLSMLRKALHRRSLNVTASKDEPQTAAISTVAVTTNIARAPSSSAGTDTSRSTFLSSSSTAPSQIRVSQPGSCLSQVMDIITTEMDIDESELADTVEWANLGLDSIMSLTICGRLREELDMEVESTIFADLGSVGALKRHFSEV